MLLPLNWAVPAEKWNSGHCLSHTRGSQCRQPSHGGLQDVSSGSSGGDGMGWGCSAQGILLIAQPQESLRLPLPWLPFPEQEGLQGENQRWSLVFHVRKESCRLAPGSKPTGTFMALQREITFVKPFVSFLFCKCVHRSVVWLHNSASRIKVSNALLSFQNNNHN